jgi:hypothetical protein
VGALLKLAAIALLTALPAAGAAAEVGDRHQFHADIATGFIAASTPFEAWPDGGLGKLRYAESGWNAYRMFADYRLRVSPTLSANIVADHVNDASAGVDLTEAFIAWRPLPRSAVQQQVRLGAFYPPLSLENSDPGWESPFTFAYSAINTWLGEEIRPIGLEWSWRRRFADLGSAHELRAFGAGFYGNDPAGTLLFWRGWSLHDRQSRLDDRLALPPAPVWSSSGAVVGLRSQALEPFVETDHRPGIYGGIEWRYANLALVQLARYDNRADPYSFANGQWGWATDFTQLALQIELPANLGLITQWMHGSTLWLSGAAADGTLSTAAELVEDDFEARFLLLTRRLSGLHRLSLRYDQFEIDRKRTPLLADAGHAWTLSYRYAGKGRFGGGIEWLAIDSQRELWPLFYGSAIREVERQVRLELTAQFGLPERR